MFQQLEISWDGTNRRFVRTEPDIHQFSEHTFDHNTMTKKPQKLLTTSKHKRILM